MTPVSSSITLTNYSDKNISKNISVKQTYRSEDIWHVYKSFNKNGDKIMDAREIESFQKTVKQFAGDNVLDNDEQTRLAAKLGVSVDELAKAIRLLDADVIALSLSQTLESKSNNATSSKLINKINEDNVTEIWTQYQSSIDDKNSFLRLFMRKDSSLAKDILDNYPKNEAKAMLNKVFNAMVQHAREENINISTLVAKYRKALNNFKAEDIDAAMREIASRLDGAVRSSLSADVMNKKITYPKLSNKNLAKMEYIAKIHKVQVTEDIAGDGVLGNTPSAATNRNAKVVLDAVNELMKNPKVKEQLSSRVRKEKNCIIVNLPNRAENSILTENGLVTTNAMTQSTVGDGDMTMFTYTILSNMQKDKFNDFNNKDAVKEYILNLFQPELFGTFRRIIK